MRRPAQGDITQRFSAAHQALDIGGQAGRWFGTPIVAPHAGTVTAAGQMGSGTNNAGLAIDVDGGRFKSRLAHNDQILVKVGQKVTEGQQIGTQGYTGYTIPPGKGGTHCHWVLWDNGTRVDPEKYLIQGGTAVTTNQQLTSRPVFRVDWYRKNYPDLAKNGVNTNAKAEAHWLKHGIPEGRTGAPNVSSKEYLANYSDLRRAYGDKNYRSALLHYFQFGINEGRFGRKRVATVVVDRTQELKDKIINYVKGA